jgi:hypothetical protein
MILANSVKEWFPQEAAAARVAAKTEPKSAIWLMRLRNTGGPNG